MRFPPQFLDELRARLPVSEVVGRSVRLKKSGSEWKGLSPFNKEKTPSFFVNDQKMAWFDFSSGKNGSIFDFVMLTEGLSFPEAVEQLASQAGMPLPKVSHEEEERDARRKTLHDIIELAAKFFEAMLAARAGAKARGYLADRGVDAPAQVRFRLGYAPAERFALKEHLGEQGIATEDMVDGGIAGRGRRHSGSVRSFPRPRDVPHHRSARTRDRVRRQGAREGRSGKVSQFAGDSALPQGRHALQHRCRARGGAQGHSRYCRRRLCRCHCHGERRLRGDGGAARHRADHRAALAAVAAVG